MRGIKVIDAEKIINDLHSKLKGLLTSDLNDESVIIKDNWFQVFSVDSNDLMSYNYTKFTFGVPSKITEIKSIDGPFYDWKTHFEFQVQSSGKAPMKVHVVMNECNVLHSFFGPKVKVGTLGTTFYPLSFDFVNRYAKITSVLWNLSFPFSKVKHFVANMRRPLRIEHSSNAMETLLVEGKSFVES